MIDLHNHLLPGVDDGSRTVKQSVRVLRAFAEQGVAPEQIEPVVRLNLQAQALGIKLDPKGSAEEQGKAVFAAVNELSDELGVTASPRFGAWDPLALAITAAPDELSSGPDLAQ